MADEKNPETEIPETEKVQESEETKTEKKDPLMKLAGDLFDIAELFVFCAAVILLVFTFVIRPTVVDGPSMEDTLLDGDYLLVTSTPYTPKQGDIVIAQNVGLYYYKDPIVKRVIATEGQVLDIDFDTWTVTVDGVVLDEPYRKLTPDDRRTSDWSFPVTIPEGYVFVMGDNRNHSADSRSKDIGLIDERCIVGRAIVRVFPFDRYKVFD